MPSKITYSVIGSSGEAEGYGAKFLEHHSPTVPGWQTPKFCTYPQELVIRLNDVSKIKKLQLLSHQYMIPSKVEFYIGNRDSSESFRRLGYIYLSNNEKTGFKSRELKSVHVDAEGQYLRIIVHKNHLNKFNSYNQSCIMAFNVIGDSVKSNRLPLKQLPDEHLLNSYLFDSNFTKPDYISPMDDLAFDMYQVCKQWIYRQCSAPGQKSVALKPDCRCLCCPGTDAPVDGTLTEKAQDPEVAEIIRRLDSKKKKAVLDENFDIAKRMKQAIADLQKVGEKLAKYELDKRRAVENEDYDLAKSKKAQMEDYRLKVYQQLAKYDLLEDAGISPTKIEGLSPLRQADKEVAREEQQQEALPHHTPFPARDSNLPAARVEPTPTPTRPDPHLTASAASLAMSEADGEASPRDDGVTSRAAAEVRNPQEPEVYDEKVIPALDKSRARESLGGGDGESPRAPPGSGEVPDGDVPPQQSEPEAMSEKSIREAASVIDVFGLPLVAGAYSKTWSFREDTLLAVYKLLHELPTTTGKDDLRAQLKAALFLVKRSIKDKVHAVFHASLKLLEYILVEYIPQHKLGKSETSRAVSTTLPALLQKTGETAARSRTAAVEFIDEMSGWDGVRPLQLVPQQLLPPFKRDTANRLALSKVELVEKLLQKFGLEPPALTVDTAMKFASSALEHAHGAVRDGATRVIFEVYKLAGSAVKSYLPQDDNRTRKNPLFRNIFDEFDRIDGRPTRTELKAQLQQKAVEDERRKKKEIAELQEQVNQLRAANDAKQGAPLPSGNQGKGKKKALAQPQQHPPADFPPEGKAENAPDAEDSDFMDKMCIFCGERDDTFTESGLDLHYWKHCPMLKRCEFCKQVVEIPLYDGHLLNECEQKSDFGKCPRCSETIAKTQLAKHVAAKKCSVLKPSTHEHCPLCHKNIPAGEESWKRHLMGSKSDACADNSRRQPSINRLQAKQGTSQAAAGKKAPGRK